MQFIDLSKQHAVIHEKIEVRIKNVLDSGKYIMGPEIFELEEKFKKFPTNEELNQEFSDI